MNQTAYRQAEEGVRRWNATHPPEHRAMVEYDAASHNYVVSISSGGGKKSFDVLEPFEERTLSGADELRMIRDLESLL